MKTKQIIPIFFIIILSLLFAGNPITDTRMVSGYDEIVLDGSGNVTIIQGNKEKVVIDADKELMDRIVTEVKGRKLHLGLKTSWNWRPKSYSTIYYTVYIKDVSGLSINGSGDIAADKVKSNDLSLRINGSGKVVIDNLKCNDLDVSINGSGECNVAGKTRRQSVQISGSGDFNAKQLRSKSAEVHINGSGDVVLQADDELDVVVSGSGDVVYYGSPAVTTHVSGSGDVIGKGETYR